MQAARRSTEDRNDFARPVTKNRAMKKRIYIALAFIALLLLAGLGLIISSGGR